MASKLFPIALFSTIYAQQLPGITYPFDAHGLSQPCIDTLNTVVRCPVAYASTFEDSITDLGIPLLDSTSLQRVCDDLCHSDLVALRANATATCTAQQDVMVYESTVFPATYFVDAYLYMYDVACYKSPNTNLLCGLIIANSTTNTTSSSVATGDCSDCYVGPMSVALEAPIGFNIDYASNLAFVTSSCGLSNYSITTPTRYALSTTTAVGSANATNQTTTGSLPAPTVPCQQVYSLKPGDTCESIAEANQVPYFGLVQANNFDIDCRALEPDQVGNSSRELCLPKSCLTHQLWYGDTCASLTAQYGITMVQLLTWNQNLDRQCINIERWRGTHICVGSPGDRPVDGNVTTSVSVSTSAPVTASPTRTAAPVPSNAYSNATRDCATWHLVVAGDTCADVSLAAQITLNELLCLNPGLNRDCTNLMLGVSYCIAPTSPSESCAGDPGVPLPPPTTTFPRPTMPSWTPEPETLGPRPPGTLDNCTGYANAFNASAITDFYAPAWAGVTATMNLCYVVAGQYGVRVADFLLWNPSLQGGASCELQIGYSYCVRGPLSSSSYAASSVVSSTVAPVARTSDRFY